jgi:hypothetical protein
VRVADRAGERVGGVGAGRAGEAEEPAPGRRADTAAQIAVPRAWPRARVDAGFTLTKTFSSATCCGRCAAITSPSESRITRIRSGRLPATGVRTQPLVT